MTERKYSVDEINSMRQSIEWSYPTGVAFYASQRTAEVEQRLRTYMQNGTEPEDLEQMAFEQMAFEQRMQEQMRELRKQAEAQKPPAKAPVKSKRFWWF